MYWPLPPMLNIPQRKANATARPARMSGVVCSSVWERLYAEMSVTRFVVGWKTQFRPEPSKISLKTTSAVWTLCCVAAMMMPLIRRAKSTVMTGTTMPPARWLSARRAASVPASAGCSGDGEGPGSVISRSGAGNAGTSAHC
jgi:hypothetical protein